MECVIDGRVCTKCCEAIHVLEDPRLDLVFSGKFSIKGGPDWDFIIRYWRPITPEEAEYINPFPFKNLDFAADADQYQFFRCAWASPNGCRCYDRRPPVCRGYPDYPNYHLHQIKFIAEHWPDGEYVKGCPPHLAMLERFRRDGMLQTCSLPSSS